MAATDTVKYGLEGTLSYNLAATADEDVTTGWVELGYVTDFNVKKNKNKIVYYKKYTKQGAKKGKLEVTGSLGQLYTTYAGSIQKLCDDDVPVALKLDVADNGGSSISETLYVSNADFDNSQFNPGNLNDTSEMSMSCDFTATDYHFVPSV
jgi:hypothetical protein